MILFINASPNGKLSSSECIIKRLIKDNDEIYLYKTKFDSINFKQYDSIVFVTPLYVDSISSKLVELMEYISDNNIDLNNKNIYLISNCGFLEYEHNYISDEIVYNFCCNNNCNFKGYFNIGSGSIIGIDNKNIFNKLLCIDFYIKIKKFRKLLYKREEVRLDTRIHPVAKWMYIRCANKGWDRQRKENHW